MLAITMRVDGKKTVVGELQLRSILKEHLSLEVLGADKIDNSSIRVLFPKGDCEVLNKEQLISILEKYFNLSVTDVILREVQSPPREGVGYVVMPLEIDEELFEEERLDAKQEETRQAILRAFKVLNRDPKKYGKNFMSIVPYYNFCKIGEVTYELWENNNHTSGVIDLGFNQVIEWAQRIANGETWEDMCNKKDRMNAYRVLFKDDEHGEKILVGGCSLDDELDFAPTAVNNPYGQFGCHMRERIKPYIVCYYF